MARLEARPQGTASGRDPAAPEQGGRTAENAEDAIRSRPEPDCSFCGARGEHLHESLRDHLFGAPGEWNMKRCPDPGCGLVWLIVGLSLVILAIVFIARPQGSDDRAEQAQLERPALLDMTPAPAPPS